MKYGRIVGTIKCLYFTNATDSFKKIVVKFIRILTKFLAKKGNNQFALNAAKSQSTHGPELCTCLKILPYRGGRKQRRRRLRWMETFEHRKPEAGRKLEEEEDEEESEKPLEGGGDEATTGMR